MSDLSIWFPYLLSGPIHTIKTDFNPTNAYVIIGNQVEQWLLDIDLADQSLAPERSETAKMRLALITIFQFAENLPDRLAVNALYTRFDWKYALHLPLNVDGFDYTLLREYRLSMMRGLIDWQVPQRLIQQVAVTGLLPLTDRRGLEVTDVLTSVANLSRIEDLSEALGAALIALAERWPHWVRGTALPYWQESYVVRPVSTRLPHHRSEQESLAEIIGGDAAYLLTAVDTAHLDGASGLVEISQLRQVWHSQFVVDRHGFRWRLIE